MIRKRGIKSLTVLCPVFNEAEILPEFVRELTAQLTKLKGYRWDVLFVVDPSPDGSLEILRRLARKDRRLRVLSLSARFGHQMSLVAGMDHLRCDVSVMMDSDLQHPPALIPKLLEKYEEGYDVVSTLREGTQGVGFFKEASSRLFYRLLNFLTEIQIHPGAADFRLLSGRVLEIFKDQIHERNLFLRGMVEWVGFRHAVVPFTAEARRAGATKYGFRRMMKFGVQGILAFSKRPLQTAIMLGVFFSAFAFVNALITTYEFFRTQAFPSGWTTLVILLSGFSGLNLLFLGIIGEYLGGVFDEVKRRPRYIVEEKINFK